MYKLDKTFFKATTLNETAATYNYWKSKSAQERIEAAIYLIKTSYRIDAFPKMEKKIFAIRKSVSLSVIFLMMTLEIFYWH